MNARLEIAWQKENLVAGNRKAVSLQIPAIIRGVLANFLPLGKVRNSDLARRVPLFFAVTAPTSSPPVAASTPHLAEAPRHQTGAWKTLPPLSPLTYYRRNIWRVLPVGGAIMISVFLIAAIVTLLNSVDDSIRTNYGSVSRFSIIAPQFAADVQPNVLAQAAKAPGLKQQVTSIPYFVLIQTVFGQMPVPIYGLEQSDMRVIAAATGNTMTQGRYPGVNEPEVALSRAWANNLHLKIGETFVPDNPRLPSLTEPQKLVGIFDGGESIAVTDKSYVIFELPEVVRRPSYMYIPQSRAQTPKLAAYLNSITDHPENFGLVKDRRATIARFHFRWAGQRTAQKSGVFVSLSGHRRHHGHRRRRAVVGLSGQHLLRATPGRVRPVGRAGLSPRTLGAPLDHRNRFVSSVFVDYRPGFNGGDFLGLGLFLHDSQRFNPVENRAGRVALHFADADNRRRRQPGDGACCDCIASIRSKSWSADKTNFRQDGQDGDRITVGIV